MAIINTYPSATPKGADLLIGTQVKDDTVLENSTKSFTVDALGSYIVTSTSGITGSGTLNTIAMFTPNGQAIGDSIMTFTPSPDKITVSGRLGVTGDFTVDNRAIFDGEYVRFNGQIQDETNNPGTAGQVLSSTGTATTWESLSSISEIKSKKVIVSTAELRNLHTTPKILVDVTAGNPKEICQVYSVVFGVGGNNASDNLIFPNDINIGSDNVNPWKYIIPQNIANEQALIAPYYNPPLTAGRIGLDSDVVLSSAGAAVETGTAATIMIVWITYRIFNIAD